MQEEGLERRDVQAEGNRGSTVVLVTTFDLVVDPRIVRDTFDDRCLGSCPAGGKRVDVALSAAALQLAEKGIRRGDNTRFDSPKIAVRPRREARRPLHSRRLTPIQDECRPIHPKCEPDHAIDYRSPAITANPWNISSPSQIQVRATSARTCCGRLFFRGSRPERILPKVTNESGEIRTDFLSYETFVPSRERGAATALG